MPIFASFQIRWPDYDNNIASKTAGQKNNLTNNRATINPGRIVPIREATEPSLARQSWAQLATR